MTMLDDGPRRVSPANFVSFINSRLAEAEMRKRYASSEEEEEEGLCQLHDLSDDVLALEVQFPKRCKVAVSGLAMAHFNGRPATCVGQYQPGRVGVVFDGDTEGSDVKALKRVNLVRL